MANYVKFQRGSQEAYDALKAAGTLDNNTLYFIYNEANNTVGALYMGSRIISGGDITIASAALDDLADVIVKGAGTNSFLVKGDNDNWVAKSLEDVVALIKNNLGDLASTAQVFQITLESNETHNDAINRAIEGLLIQAGDVVIIKELIVNGKYQHTAYIFDNNNWIPMDGNYSAANVFTPEDIQVTTAVGELAANTVVDAGTNFAELLVKILSQSKDPVKTDPSITAFSVTNSGSGKDFEAGTSITPKWTATFNAGSYTYKSTVSNETIAPVSGTGVTVNSYSVTKDGVEIGTVKDGSASAFVLGDNTVNFKIVANYGDGNYALTNLNKLPETEVRIAAGSAEKTATITTYRKMFAGGTTASDIDSALIRGLGSNAKSSTSGMEFKANVGDTKVVFAYPSNLTTKTPKFEYFTMAWESVGGFTKLGTVEVADARGGENGLKEYTVYTYTPAAPYAAETKYKVSF